MKLGLKLSLLAALVYASALHGGIFLALAILYVFLVQPHEILKDAVLKSILIVLFFTIGDAVLSVLSKSFYSLSTLFNWLHFPFTVSFFTGIISFVSGVWSIALKVLLLCGVWKSLKGKSLTIPFFNLEKQKENPYHDDIYEETYHEPTIKPSKARSYDSDDSIELDPTMSIDPTATNYFRGQVKKVKDPLYEE